MSLLRRSAFARRWSRIAQVEQLEQRTLMSATLVSPDAATSMPPVDEQAAEVAQEMPSPTNEPSSDLSTDATISQLVDRVGPLTSDEIHMLTGDEAGPSMQSSSHGGYGGGANTPPVISGFSCIKGLGDYWTMSGTVADVDDDVEGMTVDFGGVLSGYSVSASVQSDGSFEVTEELVGLSTGTATAQTEDDDGADSNLATYQIA